MYVLEIIYERVFDDATSKLTIIFDNILYTFLGAIIINKELILLFVFTLPNNILLNI